MLPAIRKGRDCRSLSPAHDRRPDAPPARRTGMKPLAAPALWFPVDQVTSGGLTALVVCGTAALLLVAVVVWRARRRRRQAGTPGAAGTASAAAPERVPDPARGARIQADLDRKMVRVARGVAHDLKNLLTVISGQARCILATSDAAAHIPWALRIEEAADRAIGLSRRLLDLDRPRPTGPLDLHRFVEDLLPILQLLTGPGARIELALGPDRALVAIDQVSMGQVLMNLVVNAGQAMPAGGTVTIATSLAADCKQAVLSVRDTGVGMNEDILRRVFEPWFTTKGEGTGLGLSVCQEIVTAAGGEIRASSAPAKGTTVAVHLPLADLPAS
jgi:signal transduction histidine kinase